MFLRGALKIFNCVANFFNPSMSAAKQRKQEKNASPLMVKFMKHLIEHQRHFIASTSTSALHGFGEHHLQVITAVPCRDFDVKISFRYGQWARRSTLRIPSQCALKTILWSIGYAEGFAIGEADWHKNAELEDARSKDMRKVILQMEFKLSCDTMGVILEFAGLEHLLRGWLHAFDCL